MAEQDKTKLPPKRVPVVRNLKLSEDGMRGVFIGKRCRNCREYLMGNPVFCLNCSSQEFDAIEFGTEGVLRTYTVIYVPPPGWKGDVPYILGSVELPEGVEVTTEVIDCPKEAIKVGMKMKLVMKVGGQDAEGNELIVHKWQPINQGVKK
jgi:uncharacterized OB-fold protein